MTDTVTEILTKHEVFKDFINFYETSWLEGKFVVCNDKHVKDKAKGFLDIVENAADRFHIIAFYKIAEDYINRKGGRDLQVLRDLAKAFEILELICVNLFLTPWRKEICSLKTFTGNFMYYVQPVLSDDTLKGILGKIGYSLTTTTEFRINGKTDDEISKSTAFELFLARIECEVISEIIKDAKDCQILDILKPRSQTPVRCKDFGTVLKEGRERPLRQATMVSHSNSESAGVLSYQKYSQSATGKKGVISDDHFSDTLNQHPESFEPALKPPDGESHDYHQRSKVHDSFSRVHYCSTSSDNLDLYNEYPEETNSLTWCFENSLKNELPQEPKEFRITDHQTFYDLATKGRKNNDSTYEDSILRDKKSKESPPTVTEQLQCSMDVKYNDEETCQVMSKQTGSKAKVMEKMASSSRQDRLNYSNVITETTLCNKANESNRGNIKYLHEEPACTISSSNTQLNFSKVVNPNLRHTGQASVMGSSAIKCCRQSQQLISNSGCTECSSSKSSEAESRSKSVLRDPLMYTDSYDCYEPKIIREPPHSLYVPPSSLSNFPNKDNNIDSSKYLTSQPDFKQNYFQKPSDKVSLITTENCIFQIKEDKKENFMVISKHKSC